MTATADEKKAGRLVRYALLLVRHPKWNLAGCMFVILFLSYKGFTNTPPTFTIDTKNFFLRETPVSNRWRARSTALSGLSCPSATPGADCRGITDTSSDPADFSPRNAAPPAYGPYAPTPPVRRRVLLSYEDGDTVGHEPSAARRLSQAAQYPDEDPVAQGFRFLRHEQRYGPWSSYTSGYVRAVFVFLNKDMRPEKDGKPIENAATMAVADTDNDALSVKGLVKLCKLVRRIAALPDYEKFCMRDVAQRCLPPLSVLNLPDNIPEGAWLNFLNATRHLSRPEFEAWADDSVQRCDYSGPGLRTKNKPGQHAPEVDSVLPDDASCNRQLGGTYQNPANGCDEELAGTANACCRADCLNTDPNYCLYSALDFNNTSGPPSWERGYDHFCADMKDLCPQFVGSDYYDALSLLTTMMPPDGATCESIDATLAAQVRNVYLNILDCLSPPFDIVGISDKYMGKNVTIADPRPGHEADNGRIVRTVAANLTGLVYTFGFRWSVPPGYDPQGAKILDWCWLGEARDACELAVDTFVDLVVDEIQKADGGLDNPDPEGFKFDFYEIIWEIRHRYTMLGLDILRASLSFVFVYFVMAFLTKSWWLAGCGMFQIFFSFQVNYFFFQMAGYDTIGLLEMVTIFIVIGVGADDIFVFYDHYHASKQAIQDPDVRDELTALGCTNDIERRFVWTYTHSVSAMLVTSLTTAVAFFGNGSSPIFAVRTFGFWAGMLIVVNYVMVCTFFGAVMAWYAYGGGCCKCWCFCCKYGLCAPCCLLARPLRPLCKTCWVDSGSPNIKKFLAESPDDSPAEVETAAVSAATHFFNTKYSDFLLRHKKRIVFGVFMFLFITLMAPGFDVPGPREPPSLWTTRSYYSRVQKLFLEQLTAESNNKLYVVWGLGAAPLDFGDPDVKNDYSSRLNTYDKEKKVTYTLFDANFDLRYAESQLAMYEFCISIVRNDRLVAGTPATVCPIVRLRDYEVSMGRPFPIPESEFEGRWQAFFADERVNRPELPTQVYYCDPATAAQPASVVRARYTGPRTICMIIVEFSIPVAGLLPKYEVAIEASDMWDEALAAYNTNTTMDARLETFYRNATSVHAQAFHTSSTWNYMDFQGKLADAAKATTMISILLSFFVLVFFTRNFAVALLAVLAIFVISFCVLGFTVKMGWALGVIESINLSILLGLAVDYVVHISHAYMGCHEETRAQKVRHALTENGQSILYGSVTTLGAGIFIGLGENAIFEKFGYYLVFTVCVSCIVALTFFAGALAMCGPENNCCTAEPCLVTLCFCCFSKREKKHGHGRGHAGIEMDNDTQSEAPALDRNRSSDIKGVPDDFGHRKSLDEDELSLPVAVVMGDDADDNTTTTTTTTTMTGEVVPGLPATTTDEVVPGLPA